MPHILKIESEKEAYLMLLKLIRKEGKRSSRYLELLNCILTIDYSEKKFNDFIELENSIAFIIGDTAKSSFARAKRVFEDPDDRLTKPSYIKRLKNYPELYNKKVVEINQIENIAYELAVKPLSSTLVFNFYRPIDNLHKQRQGYVPCPVAGDFKFRNNKLHLSIFFRSQDALNFFYPDVYYFRKIQKEVLEIAQSSTESKRILKGEIGSLSFHYSRVFLPLSMEWTPKAYVNKPEMIKIFNSLESFLES